MGAKNPNRHKANNKKIYANLYKAVDEKRLSEKVRDIGGKEIINALIAAAKDGLGPGDVPFQAYAKSYDKQIKKSGKRKFMLRGIGLQGRSGGMLDPKRFTWEIDSKGKLWLVWKGDSPEMNTYAHVHNDGLKIGKHGPSIQREWMHFNAPAIDKIIRSAYKIAAEQLVAEFNQGTI